jgi:ABC-2 type transport system permease protein
MGKTGIVIKREFSEFVRGRTFIIMTVLGPLLIAAFFALEFLIITRIGGGDYSLVIIDQSGANVGGQAAALLSNGQVRTLGKAPKYRIKTMAPAANQALPTDSLNRLVAADSLDGYVVIPAGIMSGDTARYFGANATNRTVTVGVESALEQSVQSIKLARKGVDAAALAEALEPVPMSAEKIGKHGLVGPTGSRRELAYMMVFAIYIVTMLYGQSIMNSVLEEKRDKIVEVLVSSIPARGLLIGKVVGIGAGGALQMLVWIVFTAVALTYAPSIGHLLNLGPEKMAMVNSMAAKLPHVPLSVGVIYFLFFMAGFFMYATLFAVIGSMVTTNQEAQQLAFPAIMPMVIGFLMGMTALTNPDSPMAVAGSMIPLTSPIVMPIRTVVGSATPFEVGLSLWLSFTTGFVVLWLAGKIYRIGIFATGQKVTLREAIEWLRAAD